MIHWGIIGAGNIAGRFADSVAKTDESEITAISCRSQEKADGFMEKHSAKRAYIGHDALLDDDEIDAVYIALPHGLHMEWAIKALEKKKAVLCEKPAAMSASEMSAIADASHRNETLFMEAMKSRFVPAYVRIKELINDGIIGEIEKIETSLCNVFPFDTMPKTYHTDPVQGGCLLDEGIYCACWLEDYLGAASGLSDIETNIIDDVDHYVNAFLDFNGKQARLECAFDRSKPRQAVISGSKGRIVVEDLHRAQTFLVETDGMESFTEEHPYEIDDFYSEIHHFVSCLDKGLTESPVMPLDASIRCAEMLDIIREGF